LPALADSASTRGCIPSGAPKITVSPGLENVLPNCVNSLSVYLKVHKEIHHIVVEGCWHGFAANRPRQQPIVAIAQEQVLETRQLAGVELRYVAPRKSAEQQIGFLRAGVRTAVQEPPPLLLKTLAQPVLRPTNL
jgi:hypothetical protein